MATTTETGSIVDLEEWEVVLRMVEDSADDGTNGVGLVTVIA